MTKIINNKKTIYLPKELQIILSVATEYADIDTQRTDDEDKYWADWFRNFKNMRNKLLINNGYADLVKKLTV